MMHISAIFSIFSIFILAPFLVQIGETTGVQVSDHIGIYRHSQQQGLETPADLKNLIEMSQKFHNTIIVQMWRKCTDDKHFHFDPKKDFARQIQKDYLCEYVKKLDGYLAQLKEKANGIRIHTILDEIHLVIINDMENLKREFHLLLHDNELATSIIGEVMKIAEIVLKEGNELGLDKKAFKRENMDSAFQTKFRDFKSGLKNARTFDPDSHVKDAFKLLCIGEKMQPLFQESVEEKTKWAFQQFSVNLEMYYFRLEYHLEFVDHEKGEFQTITQIAHEWPIGMIEISQIFDD